MNFILFTDQFGYKLYIADELLSDGLPVTDTLAEALVFSHKNDNEQLKLKTWSKLTGYKLQIETIN